MAATADTIAALLAKAEGTDNEHERDAFTRKATALMIKLGIDEATVRARGTKKGEAPKEAIVTATVPMKSRYGRGLQTVGFAVVNNLNGLRGWYISRPNSEESTVYIVGFESDVKRAVQLIESLKLQALSASIRWAKSEEGQQEIKMQAVATGKSIQRSTWKARRTFLSEFGRGAGERIREVWGEAVKEAPKSTEVALRDRQAQVDEYVDSTHKFKTGRGFGLSYAGSQAGREAGRKADVGGRKVSDANRSQLS